MLQPADKPETVHRYWPLAQLVVARFREFYREPEAIFWVYGFPLLMALALGIAFRNKPEEKSTVDVQESAGAQQVADVLAADPRLVVQVRNAEECRYNLHHAKTDVVVAISEQADSSRTGYEYSFDPSRPEGRLARNVVDALLARAADPTKAPPFKDHPEEEQGGRYIDFLIPGLVGTNLMGGGLWGVGFVTVDMRVRKLLKRFRATPMRKSDFLLAIMLSRLLFTVPELLLLLTFAYFIFHVTIQGAFLALLVLIVVGAMSFMGIGLLVASRPKTTEAVSGLMNLVMLPMYVLSGVFFSSKNFPDAAQPFIKALPLTALNDALRAVMLDGASLAEQLPRIGILAAWGGVSFFLALRWFRWS
jgi:ABC-type multidrug transport system permease subunit